MKAEPRSCKVCHEPIQRAAPLSPKTCMPCYIAARKARAREPRVVPAYRMTRAIAAVRPKVIAAAPAVKRARRGPTKAKSAAEQRWMDRVAGLPCRVCGAGAVELHHIREGQGAAQRAQHTLVLPLCPEHHRGASGLHGLGKRGFAARYRRDELDLLAETIEALA